MTNLLIGYAVGSLVMWLYWELAINRAVGDGSDASVGAIPRMIRVKMVRSLSKNLYPLDRGKYHELIMAVETKYAGEDRHATALRYIQEREAKSIYGKENQTGTSDRSN